jgi:nitrogen regulatory protein PII
MAGMKEIKAFIHRNRVADVVRAFGRAGFRNMSIIDVKVQLTARGHLIEAVRMEGLLVTSLGRALT